MIIIGSRAAKYHFPEFRNPKDWDIVASLEEIKAFAEKHKEDITSMMPNASGEKMKIMLGKIQTEVEIVEMIESAQMLYDFDFKDEMNFFGENAKVVSPNILFLMKDSHIRYPIHWKKNIEDYHFFKEKTTAFSNEELMWNKLRKEETKARSKVKAPSLEMSNSDFFRQKKLIVDHYYPHDVYHWAVAYQDKPLFTKMKIDHNKAKCEKHLFEKMTHQEKLNCVREETMVIALERYIIPKRKKDLDDAYLSALERVCTTLTSGWFREFALNHYHELKERDLDYLKKFNENLVWAQGKVEQGGSQNAINI